MNFTISEFNISGNAIPEQVADKILKWHIVPMQRVRDVMGVAIWASQRSGYRSLIWEKSKGRNGSSQHTFKTMGAVDWTCLDFKKNKERFLGLIQEHTTYSRMAVYDSFIHCDYKPTKTGRREVYTSTDASKWTFKKFV